MRFIYTLVYYLVEIVRGEFRSRRVTSNVIILNRLMYV